MEVRDFAQLFVDLQEQRHKADYDPIATFHKTGVDRWLLEARAALGEFERAERRDRKSFAALVLFRSRD